MKKLKYFLSFLLILSSCIAHANEPSVQLPSLKVQVGHGQFTKPVKAYFSNDGLQVLTYAIDQNNTGDSGSLVLWDVQSGIILERQEFPRFDIKSLTYFLENTLINFNKARIIKDLKLYNKPAEKNISIFTRYGANNEEIASDEFKIKWHDLKAFIFDKKLEKQIGTITLDKDESFEIPGVGSSSEAHHYYNGSKSSISAELDGNNLLLWGSCESYFYRKVNFNDSIINLKKLGEKCQNLSMEDAFSGDLYFVVNWLDLTKRKLIKSLLVKSNRIDSISILSKKSLLLFNLDRHFILDIENGNIEDLTDKRHPSSTEFVRATPSEYIAKMQSKGIALINIKNKLYLAGSQQGALDTNFKYITSLSTCTNDRLHLGYHLGHDTSNPFEHDPINPYSNIKYHQEFLNINTLDADKINGEFMDPYDKNYLPPEDCIINISKDRSENSPYYFIDSKDKGLIEIYNKDADKMVYQASNEDGKINAATLIKDNKYLITAHENGILTVRSFNSNQKTLLAKIILRYNYQSYLNQSSNDDTSEWFVTTTQGRFDTNTLERLGMARWIMPDDPLRPISVEMFYRDFYEPRLLHRILECQGINDVVCNDESLSIPDLTKLNRAQPIIKEIEVTTNNLNINNVDVTIKAQQAIYKLNQIPERHWESGVCDIRLFRNNQLIARPSSKIENSNIEDSLISWKKNNCLELNNNEISIKLKNIKLPSESTSIQFSAYAFNSDKVKGPTKNISYEATKEQKEYYRKPRAYIITIGVEYFEHENWNLNYAAEDAESLRKILVKRLSETSEFDIIPITLVAKKMSNGLHITQATKANIRALFQILAGHTIPQNTLNTLKESISKEEYKNLTQLQAATPDDLVLIGFSSHGYSDNEGNFYLMPHDFGYKSLHREFIENDYVTENPEINISESLLDRSHLISSNEIADWLKFIDAGDIALIIDACYSEASVAQEGFKPAPMGAKGLGQMAYDKGIRILTATRKNLPAYEKDGSGGILTEALVVKGLIENKADHDPIDNKIYLGEWFKYVSKDLPVRMNDARKKAIRIDSIEEENIADEFIQYPVIFDYRKNKKNTLISNIINTQ